MLRMIKIFAVKWKKEWKKCIIRWCELVQTSSFYFPTYEEFMAASIDEKNNYVYTRGTNPTTEILEKKIARLERGEKCKVFASGMGAISATLFTLLQQGDHVLMVNTIYGESVSFVQYLEKFGVSLTKVDVAETEELFQFVQENTKVIYFESPSSQKFELLDLEKITALAQKLTHTLSLITRGRHRYFSILYAIMWTW